MHVLDDFSGGTPEKIREKGILNRHEGKKQKMHRHP